LIDITSEVTKGKTEPTPVLVAFDRDSERLVTVVKVGTKNLEDPGREVRKAYLPIEMQVITRDIAEALGVGERTGVRVTQVYPESAAEKAGLKVGDLIVALDGEEIPASQPEDTEVLPAMIRQYKIGMTAELSVLRGKKEMTIPVVLEESPALQREMRKYRNDDFEFTVRDLAFRDRVKKSLDKDVIGVYVEEINRGGWAALGRLSTGDIVRAVDGQLIHNVDEMRATMEKIAQNRPKHVVLSVRRGVQDLFVELETDWSK
jgi:serine protease Do